MHIKFEIEVWNSGEMVKLKTWFSFGGTVKINLTYETLRVNENDSGDKVGRKVRTESLETPKN